MNGIPHVKQRVADIGSPQFHGTVIEAGPYVSEVRWDDKHERGATQFIPNEKLIQVASAASICVKPIDLGKIPRL